MKSEGDLSHLIPIVRDDDFGKECGNSSILRRGAFFDNYLGQLTLFLMDSDAPPINFSAKHQENFFGYVQSFRYSIQNLLRVGGVSTGIRSEAKRYVRYPVP